MKYWSSIGVKVPVPRGWIGDQHHFLLGWISLTIAQCPVFFISLPTQKCFELRAGKLKIDVAVKLWSGLDPRDSLVRIELLRCKLSCGLKYVRRFNVAVNGFSHQCRKRFFGLRIT